MKFSRDIKGNCSPIYGILTILALLCLSAITIEIWPTKIKDDLPQWWNQNLETFRRELVETQSDHPQQMLEKTEHKPDNVRRNPAQAVD